MFRIGFHFFEKEKKNDFHLFIQKRPKKKRKIDLESIQHTLSSLSESSLLPFSLPFSEPSLAFIFS